jgi:cytochrome c
MKLVAAFLGILAAFIAMAQLPADPVPHLDQKAEQQAKRGATALGYRLMHWDAALGQSDRETLAELTPLGAVDPGPVPSGDPERGRALFGRRCSGCHTPDSDREGPHLRGVYGRRAGSLPGFQYSSAVKKSGVIWKNATLDTWLRDSDSMMPGSAMEFSVPKPQERADLIAFLRTLR